MKLIAKKSFFNSKVLGIVLDKAAAGFEHPDQIHKAARFSIGKAETFSELSAQEQEHVGTLLKHGLVVFDNDENVKLNVISKIDKEAAAEVAAAQKLAAIVKPATVEDVLKSLPELIAAAVAAATATPPSAKK